MSVGRLTAGERFLIERLRHERSQTAAARLLRIRPSRYGMLERDQLSLSAFTWSDGQPLRAPRVNPLRPHERCVIYRRRVGHTQSQVADVIGCSRVWVNRMERGLEACDELLWYWEQ